MANSNPRRILRLGPGARHETGLIAPVAEQATGELRTHVFAGTARPVEALAAWVDRLGPTWKVRTICTPASIHSDLVNDGRRRHGQQIEAQMLSRIGRADLVESVKTEAGTGRARVILSRRRRV